MYAEQVREFAAKVAEKPLPNTPNPLTQREVAFIVQMVTDELNELKAAQTVVEQADALVDAIYYILHAACKHGINLDPLFTIVHDANMAKVATSIDRRADGKILKPADWQPPEPKLAHALHLQQTQGAFNHASSRGNTPNPINVPKYTSPPTSAVHDPTTQHSIESHQLSSSSSNKVHSNERHFNTRDAKESPKEASEESRSKKSQPRGSHL